jgi:elongator complex protein 1
MERKIGSGRKGTVDEEEYLLKSITKLVEKFAVTIGMSLRGHRVFAARSDHIFPMCQGEVRSLLPHLFQFTDEHREEGLHLQREVGDFEQEIQEALDEIWARTPFAEGDEEPEQIGWAARMAEIERSKAINPLDKVPKPDLSQAKDWRVKLMDHK